MPDGKIYITISDRRLDGDTTPEEEQKKDESKDFGSYLIHKALDFAKQEAQQFVNYSISNIGNFTGNYEAQAHIQEAIRGVNILTNIGMSALAGFKLFGGAGAAAGAIFAFASQSVNMAMGEYQQWFANKKMNHNIDMVRQLSGLNQLTDGSRGTMG